MWKVTAEWLGFFLFLLSKCSEHDVQFLNFMWLMKSSSPNIYFFFKLWNYSIVMWSINSRVTFGFTIELICLTLQLNSYANMVKAERFYGEHLLPLCRPQWHLHSQGKGNRWRSYEWRVVPRQARNGVLLSGGERGRRRRVIVYCFFLFSYFISDPSFRSETKNKRIFNYFFIFFNILIILNSKKRKVSNIKFLRKPAQQI